MTPEPIYLDMPLEEAMRTQRAIRRLKPDPVDDALLLHVIDLALRAPVGSNQQKWEFVVVKERSLKAELGNLNRRLLGLYHRFARRTLQRSGVSMQRIAEAVQWQSEHFEEIPVVIIACYRGRPAPFPFVATTSWFGSIYPAVQNLLLAARAAGLGAALITMPLWNMGRVRRLLDLPCDVTPCAVIPMGWPLDKYGPTKRKPVGNVVHVDRFGNQPFRTGEAPLPTRAGRIPGGAIAAGIGAALLVGLILNRKS